MFTRKALGRRIIVGSSMGGWLAMLLYRELQLKNPRAARRIAGLVLLAPAADMTADLMWDSFPDAVKEELAEKGVWMRPSLYGEPYAITARLITDGEQHLILKDGLEVDCPVRILQGDVDPDVPAPHAVKVFNAISGQRRDADADQGRRSPALDAGKPRLAARDGAEARGARRRRHRLSVTRYGREPLAISGEAEPHAEILLDPRIRDAL